MKNFHALLCILCLSLCSCFQQRSRLSQEKMVKILTDLYISKVLSNDSVLTNEQVVIHPNRIYKMHNTDSITFNQSYQYYLSQPVQIESIYTIVIDSLKLKSNL